jgi:hypothetical protein
VGRFQKEGKCKMAYAKEHWTDGCDDWERFSTEELLEWALDMDFSGTGAFVWDVGHGLDSGKKTRSGIDLSRESPDELLSNLSPNDRPALPGDRRRRGC